MILFSFLVLLTINYSLIFFLGKFNYQVLSCGLTGFFPKKGKKVNLNALFFLAIANEERGTDSCGMSVGFEVFKGVTKEAKARDFIMENKAKLRKLQYKDKPVIFHTRKSTKGAHSEFNA